MACRVVAQHGFARATMARIARAAGYTTGMVAHYYDSKQQIILAALRLMLRRIEQRVAARSGDQGNLLLDVLAETLPLDPRRFLECAFWMAFWGQVSTDRTLKRLNAWVHREYLRQFSRCFAAHWPEWSGWSPRLRDQVLRSAVTCMNGLTASAVTSPRDWPATAQIELLRLQLEMLRGWAALQTRAAPRTRARRTVTRG